MPLSLKRKKKHLKSFSFGNSMLKCWSIFVAIIHQYSVWALYIFFSAQKHVSLWKSVATTYPISFFFRNLLFTPLCFFSFFIVLSLHLLDRFVCCASGRLGAILGGSVPFRALARHQTPRAAQPKPEICLHVQCVSSQVWKHTPVAEISRKLAQSQPHSWGETDIMYTGKCFSTCSQYLWITTVRNLEFRPFTPNSLIMDVWGKLSIWPAI